MTHQEKLLDLLDSTSIQYDRQPSGGGEIVRVFDSTTGSSSGGSVGYDDWQFAFDGSFMSVTHYG